MYFVHLFIQSASSGFYDCHAKTSGSYHPDGFGHSESHKGNAILAAKMPVMDRLYQTMPNGLISGSGMDVGLPDGQMGNSEVGHMNLGAGRVVYQDFTRVTKAIRDGEFFENPTICAAVDKAVSAGKAVHIMGLLSDGGVHSHQTIWWRWRNWRSNAEQKNLPARLSRRPRHATAQREEIP